MFLFISVTLLTIMASVLLHLVGSQRLVALWDQNRQLRRWRIGILVVVFIVIHMIEIGFFTVGINVLLKDGGFGYLDGMGVGDIGGLIYYSAITYTTVGYGDITPVGNLRLFAGIEALTGMVLVAWTASAIFTVMHRIWKEQQSEPLEKRVEG